eukprot:77494-Rhodomonas_salina.1
MAGGAAVGIILPAEGGYPAHALARSRTHSLVVRESEQTREREREKGREGGRGGKGSTPRSQSCSSTLVYQRQQTKIKEIPRESVRARSIPCSSFASRTALLWTGELPLL